MRCTTAATGPTARFRSRRRWSATSWAIITRTATSPSTTPSCDWSSRGRCAIRSLRAKATSARPATWARPHPGTPRCGWRPSPWKWCATSRNRRSISSPITTARFWSRPFSRRASRICSSTDPKESPSAWRRGFRRTTCEKSRPASSGIWRTPTRRKKSCSRPSSSGSRGLTSRRAPSSSEPVASRTCIAPATGRSPSGRSSKWTRSMAGSASSSPTSLIRSTPTACSTRWSRASRTVAFPALPTSVTRPRGAPVSASSSF